MIYTMVKMCCRFVQNIMLYLVIGKMHKNTMKTPSDNLNVVLGTNKTVK